MNEETSHRFGVIFSEYRKLAGIELYNRNTGEEVYEGELYPFTYIHNGEDWEGAMFLVRDKRGKNIIVRNLGLRNRVVNDVFPISISEAMRSILEVKENGIVT